MGQIMNDTHASGKLAAKMSVALLLGVAISAIVEPSFAQAGSDSAFNRERNVSVVERERPEYDSLGLRRGSFILRPKIDSYAVFTDNAFATPTDESEDVIITANPSLTVESDWASHNLRTYIDVNHQEYLDNSSESTTGYSLRADGGYDINRAVSIDAGLGFRNSYEQRSSVGANSISDEPIEFNRTDAYIGASREVGRTRLGARVSVQELNYQDATQANGSVLDQDFRDQRKLSFEGRADYALSPDKSVFVQTIYSEIDNYRPPASGIVRDRKTMITRAGADFELSNLVRGQVGAGYFNTEFRSNAFQDVDGLSVDARLEWFATPLITVTGTGERGTQPSELLISPATTQTNLGAKVDYEYRRNIILSTGYQYTDDDYNFIDRSDQRNAVYLGGVVLLNPRVGVESRISRRSLKSKGALRQQNFNETRLLIGLRYQL